MRALDGSANSFQLGSYGRAARPVTAAPQGNHSGSP